jgi:hypothetical protein
MRFLPLFLIFFVKYYQGYLETTPVFTGFDEPIKKYVKPLTFLFNYCKFKATNSKINSMNKINEINLSAFHNSEHFQFMTDVDALVTKHQPVNLSIESEYPEFKLALTSEDAAMKIESGSSKSKLLEDENKLRGKTWRAIDMKVDATIICPIAEEVNSAMVLRRIIDIYGDVRQSTYNEASALITNLTTDLLKAANTAHLNTVGVATWVGALKKENEDFQSLFNDRGDEYAGRISGDVGATRQVIDPLYETLVEKVNATVVTKLAKPVASTFINELNERIRYYQVTITTRKARNKKGKGVNTGGSAGTK